MRDRSHSSLERHLVHTRTTPHRLRSTRGEFGSDLLGGTKAVVKGVARSLRSQWRCLKHTGWLHEIDLHSGACRYCGARTNERL